MAVSPTVRINVSGARGPRGAASGPLGLNSVGADEINAAEADGIREKIEPAKGVFDTAEAFDQDQIGGKLRQLPSPLDRPYLAAGDATSDDTAAVNDAIADVSPGGSLIIPSGKKLRVTSLINDVGIGIEGGGQIVVGSGASSYQLNDYARSKGFVVGREYMYRLYSIANSAGVQLNCYLYSDSTGATSANGGIPGGANTPDVLLTEYFRNNGVRNPIVFTNRSNGGDDWTDANPLPDLAASTDLMVFKYAINHVSGQSVVAEISSMRAKLAAVRGASFGDVANLTIVLVGPNSTHDTAGGRTSAWYELLRGGYEQAARDYQCVYIDLYGLFQDSRSWAGLYADNPAVHPQDLLRQQMWAYVGAALFPQGSLQVSTGNRRIGLTYQNGWANRSAGGAYAGAVYSTPDGRIKARGEATPPSNTVTINDAIFLVPNSNYRPAADVFRWAAGYNGSDWVPWPMGIDVAGKVFARKSGTGITAFRFDGMEWDTL